MANGSLPQFVGPDVLDPAFQQLVARDIPLGKAMQEIMEALRGGDLRLFMRVVGGMRALQPMHCATKEEEEQARREYYAAVAKYDYDAAADAVYGTSPPGGITSPIDPEAWGIAVTLVIRNHRLVIEWLTPTFPPESYGFAIANREAVDKLLVTTAHASVSLPRPPDAAPAVEHVAWAVRYLQITDPDKLAGLRGKKLQKLICSTVGPNFSCDQRTIQRGRKRADSM